MGAFCLHRHQVPVNCLYHARMVLSVGWSFAYFARNAPCTITADLLLWYSNTQNYFSPGASIFSLHTLASVSGRNVNYDEKQLTGNNFLSCSFYLHRFCKYVSYGLPIINFCNFVHYETPCIMCLGLYVPCLVHFRSIENFLLCCEVQYASTILLLDTVALWSLDVLGNAGYWPHLMSTNAFNEQLWRWRFSTVYRTY